MRALDGSYGPRKELLRANIEGQDMARTQLVEDTSQGGTIGSKEEKLGPEAIGLLFIIVVILIRNKGGSVKARAHSGSSADIYLLRGSGFSFMTTKRSVTEMAYLP